MNNRLSILRVEKLETEFVSRLPVTHALLTASNLVIHPSVSRVVIHGSRGLANRYRPDSDIDLSLLIDVPQEEISIKGLNEILEITLQNWDSEIELDLAVIFDMQKCGLKCFDHTTWEQDFCRVGGMDCFGLYKTQKGFHGIVTNAGIQVWRMYPCLKIWQKN